MVCMALETCRFWHENDDILKETDIILKIFSLMIAVMVSEFHLNDTRLIYHFINNTKMFKKDSYSFIKLEASVWPRG